MDAAPTTTTNPFGRETVQIEAGVHRFEVDGVEHEVELWANREEIAPIESMPLWFASVTGRIYVYDQAERVLVPRRLCHNGNGYVTTTVLNRATGRTVTYLVHRLTLEAFAGHAPKAWFAPT